MVKLLYGTTYSPKKIENMPSSRARTHETVALKTEQRAERLLKYMPSIMQ